MAPKRDAKGRFLHGEVGNPGGRPKRFRDLTQLIIESTDNGNACVQLYLTIMNNPEAANKDRIQCATHLLAYAFGKPTQQVVAKVDTVGDITFRWETDIKEIE